MNEEKLIQLCLKRNKEAWDEFIEKYSNLVLWSIKQRLNRLGCNFSQEDVFDIHQDVFFCIWQERKLNQLKDKSKIVAWLSMVSGNKAVDYFRLIKRQNINTVSLDEENSEILNEEILSTNKPIEDIYSHDIISAVDEIIEEFSAQEKIILKFNLMYQKTHQEISDMLNISINTVSTAVSRSKEKLKEKLIRKGLKDF